MAGKSLYIAKGVYECKGRYLSAAAFQGGLSCRGRMHLHNIPSQLSPDSDSDALPVFPLLPLLRTSNFPDQ